MKRTLLVKGTLVLSGLIGAGVGLGILFTPRAFHASAGITLGDDVNLLNEMRSSGGMLFACSLFVLYGAIRSALAILALLLAATLYLTYGLSRAVSVLIDGVPNAAMLQIMGLELAIAVLCLLALGSLQVKGSATA